MIKSLTLFIYQFEWAYYFPVILLLCPISFCLSTGSSKNLLSLSQKKWCNSLENQYFWTVQKTKVSHWQRASLCFWNARNIVLQASSGHFSATVEITKLGHLVDVRMCTFIARNILIIWAETTFSYKTPQSYL